MKFLLILSVCVVLMHVNANPGRGGGSGRSSGGSRSRGSSSSSSKSSSGGLFGGWFGSSKSSSSNTASKSTNYGSSMNTNYGSSSNTAPKSYGWNDNLYKSPGTSYTAPKPSAPVSNTGTSYGWNVNGQTTGVQKQTNNGLNAGNTQAGWNIGQGVQKPSAPVGPPPAYPGLGHNPVASHNLPPAYSPSHINPPAYSPSHINPPAYSPSHINPPSYGAATNTQYRPQNSYNQPFGQTQYNHQYGSVGHGSGTGYNGFGQQPSVVNNYYGTQQSRGGSGLMTNAMFYGVGMHHGHSWGSNSGRRWSDDEDRRWRATTKAPYFENKVPGSNSVMPAAAVLGAASVFGVASLLPLRVPIGKPLLSCNETYLNQTDIRLEGNLYECANNTILISCHDLIGSIENRTDDTNTCKNGTFVCILENGQTDCSNATLSFQKDIVCNSTYYVVERNSTELHCYFGTLNDSQVIYIPTVNPLEVTTIRVSTTEQPPLTTRMANFVYGYILWGLGKSDLIEPISTTEKELSTTEKIPVSLEDTKNSTTEVIEVTKNITVLVMNSTIIEQSPLHDIPIVIVENKSQPMKLNDTVILSEEQKIVESHKIIEQALAEIQNSDTELDSGSNDLKKMSKMFQETD